jgi:hypothetical protein
MAAYGVIANPFLERIRAEMSELERIFETYRDKGLIPTETLPQYLPSLYDLERPKHVAFEGLQEHYHTLQEHYHTLQEQEAAMVLASNDDQQIHRQLQRTKKLIDLIEKVLQKKRVTHYYPMTLPKCLLSCHDKTNRIDGKALHKAEESEIGISIT